MNLNATLLGQMLTFIVLVWFTMKFVWPPVMAALDERAKKIAEGLEAAQKSREALSGAQSQIAAELTQAKARAAAIQEEAAKQAQQTIEAAKKAAEVEAERVRQAAAAELAREAEQVRQQLRQRVSELALLGASRILEREIRPEQHQEMLAQLSAQL